MANADGEKIINLLGLAMRARKLLLGVDNIKSYRKRLYMVFADGLLSAGNTETLKRYCERVGAALVITPVPVADIIHKPGCKAVGLTDEGFYKGIKKELGGGQVSAAWVIIGGLAD